LIKPAVLNQNKDFRRLYWRGKSTAHPVLVCYVMRNRTGACRVGITASKKIGKAVKRNRARRIIREAYRQLKPKINGNWDIVLVARAKTVFSKSTKVATVMQDQFVELGLMKL